MWLRNPNLMGVWARIRAALPAGRPLEEEIWQRRHRGLVLTLWVHVVCVPLFGMIRGIETGHALLEGVPLAVLAIAASWTTGSRGFRALSATLGLVTSSAIIVHFSGGTIEAHFHFFVMVTLIILYQSWLPFIAAIGYVIVHHGVFGTIDPESVYNHPAAIADPWTWAGIHGAFILGLCVAGLVVWKRTEELAEAREEAHRKLFEASVRQRDALEINDTILQRLVVANYSFAQGNDQDARAAVRDSLVATQKLVSELLSDDDIAPGKLVRNVAAGVNGSDTQPK